ncbi:MAG: response regulator [Deltaproteobacteria bacterium]|nr:response regulator [Deltaproteobacteria bacterium]
MESHHSQNRFRTVFDIAPMGIAIADREGCFLEANPAACRMFGCSRAELIGPAVDERHPAESMPAIRQLFQSMARGEQSSVERIPITRPDGTTINCSITATVTEIDGRQVIVAFVADVTDQLLSENELERRAIQTQQAQKMEAIGTLAGGVAHDFNNLLMGIQGNVSLMLLNKAPDDRDVAYLKNIEKGIMHGAELTRQVLGFARGGKYEVQATDLNHLIDRVASMFSRSRKEISVRKTLQESLWAVEVAQGPMEQVLLCLFVNAMEAMPGGGELILETANVSVEEGTSGRPPDAALGRYVCITVTDTGIGMDAQTQVRIFESPFAPSKTGTSTGPGLSSAYGIVQSHHGFITVRSRKGRGSTFRVFLPASAPAATHAQPAIPPGREERKTLMLVEDEDMVAVISDQMLTRLGHKVFVARSGPDALSIFQEHREKIDLVILDMIMPGMSGAETFERLKAIDPRVNVLLSSGYALNGPAEDILRRGCRGFIQKPFTIEQLSQKIREILSSGQDQTGCTGKPS